MRVGFNPVYKKNLIQKPFRHRIIIPVYIDRSSDYFVETVKIFKKCLSSFIETKSAFTAITVVLNGYDSELFDFLSQQIKTGSLDSLVLNRFNLGKVNAILQVARTVQEEYLTISDSDILIHDGWEQGVFDVFKHFPRALAVSPLYLPSLSFVSSISTFTIGVLSRKLIYVPSYSNLGIDDFYKSINRLPNKENGVFVKSTIGDKILAGMGGPHFCYTVHSSVFKLGPKGSSHELLTSQSEFKFIDGVIDALGGLRLSTTESYAQHMGNTLKSFNAFILNKSYTALTNEDFDKIGSRKAKRLLIFHLFKFIVNRKKLRNFVLKMVAKKCDISQTLNFN
jgi:hypothetical protein